MFEHRDAEAPKQEEFWVEKKQLPAATAGRFYRKLDETLSEMEFAEKVREACRPAYKDEEAGGRPGIDPAVYFKMLMIGFFENLPSERAIASRCEDSLSLRAFLGYDLTENTPDLKKLAAEAGIDPDDTKAVRRFDKKRKGRKTSNEDWVNPHELRRNKDKQCKVTRQTLNSAKRAVKSKSGKALLKKRGEHLERSFAHVLDQGGLRRATLRGVENLTKRQIAAAMTFDLSLLMRKVFGFGTPKQWAAKALLYLFWHWKRLVKAMGSAGEAISRFGPGKILDMTLYDDIRPGPWCRG